MCGDPSLQPRTRLFKQPVYAQFSTTLGKFRNVRLYVRVIGNYVRSFRATEDLREQLIFKGPLRVKTVKDRGLGERRLSSYYAVVQGLRRTGNLHLTRNGRPLW
jgi:hypothetical protein